VPHGSNDPLEARDYGRPVELGRYPHGRAPAAVAASANGKLVATKPRREVSDMGMNSRKRLPTKVSPRRTGAIQGAALT
jgi:hypothetical protein